MTRRVRFQRRWPPVRRETVEDIERDIRRAEAGRAFWEETLKSSPPARSSLYDDEAGSRRSWRMRLQSELEDAITDEDRVQAVESIIRAMMNRGYKYHVARRRVAKLLEELTGEVE